jgi:SprT protein
MAKASSRPLGAEMNSAIVSWQSVWNVPRLANLTRATFSERLQRSLGRCTPATGRVSLASRLRRGSRDRLLETFCHEVAHVAVYQLHGSAVRPHGPEWAALVRAAGYEPHTRVTRRQRAQPTTKDQPAVQYPIVHTCPVCHNRRFARRVMRAWRCRTCVDNGLAGELIATRTNV